MENNPRIVESTVLTQGFNGILEIKYFEHYKNIDQNIREKIPRISSEIPGITSSEVTLITETIIGFLEGPILIYKFFPSIDDRTTAFKAISKDSLEYKLLKSRKNSRNHLLRLVSFIDSYLPDETEILDEIHDTVRQLQLTQELVPYTIAITKDFSKKFDYWVTSKLA